MRKYDAVLFDLDGTLSDSAQGVRTCIELTMERMGRACPDLSDYSAYVGPPLDMTFENLCGLTPEQTLTALSIYRAFYDIHGTRSNRLYDGMRETLTAVRDAGMRLAVCSSKDERLARDVTDLLGVSGLFDAICGSLPDNTRRTKPELIPYVMGVLGVSDATRTVMIGDTHFDALGAAACGTAFIGVRYGYGREELMRDAGALMFADTPADLLPYLL